MPAKLTQSDDEGKTCLACGEYKPYSEYSRAPKGIGGRATRCKSCHREAERKRRSTQGGRSAYYFRRYGLTAEAFLALYRQQDGRCAVCGRPFVTWTNACIDHNHQTREIRGLLCLLCNWAIGHFEEDLARMRAAIKYLEGRASPRPPRPLTSLRRRSK